MVFVGWDASTRGYYTNVVDLCPHCDGWGEDPETDTFCANCQAEGVNWNGRTIALSGLSFDALVAALGKESIALTGTL
ncbi:MAG: hypothetical protein JOZ81_27860, partial [Chloroflexi bacterium]|nr:hypothetical protein [Chloroflexota bacterium]